MKPNPKWTAAALVVLAAATVPPCMRWPSPRSPWFMTATGPARVAPKPMTIGRPLDAGHSGARFLAHRTAEDPIAGGAAGRGFTLQNI